MFSNGHKWSQGQGPMADSVVVDGFSEGESYFFF